MPENDTNGGGGQAAASGEPVGQGDYVVRQGDCISSIAAEHGHFWKTIWNDPANSELRQARGNPNILLPGDRLHIPDLQTRQEPAQTEKKHRFRRKGEPSHLRLQVLHDDEPRRNTPYRLVIDGQGFIEGETDDEGRLDVPISGKARGAKLYVGDLANDEGQEVYTIELGTMDPTTDVGGIQGRLTNLGFSCGQEDGRMGPETQAALRAFQEKHQLPVTGQADQATVAKLVEIHGS